MCGIVGCVGKQDDVRMGLDALKRLEYRGYDSAGLAVATEGNQEIKSLADDVIYIPKTFANVSTRLNKALGVICKANYLTG